LWTFTVRGGGAHPQLTGLAVAAAVFVALSSLFSGDYYDARLAWLFAALAAAAAVTPGRAAPPGRVPAAGAATAPPDPATAPPDPATAPPCPVTATGGPAPVTERVAVPEREVAS
jgi:hypothetical protein